MASSRPLVPSAPFTAERLAHHLHTADPSDAPTVLAWVVPGPGADPQVRRWVPPGILGHPVDHLVGFRAPPDWAAVALLATGRARHLDHPRRPPCPVRSTLVVDGTGAAAAISERRDDGRPVAAGSVEGWTVDVLRRVLGVACAPPTTGTGALAEITWLERLVRALCQRPDARRTWAWMADAHPFRRLGPVPSPATLAARTRSSPITWAQLRRATPLDPLPAEHHGPPGRVLAARDWFDDGSLSRWALAVAPPADQLVGDVAELLDEPLRARLGDALVTVALPTPDRP